MLKIAFSLLGISICIFARIMLHEPRTLWSGVSLLGMLLCSAVTMFFLLSEYSGWLAEHDLFMNILVALLLLTVGCAFVFPVIFIVTLFIEGIKVIRHKGLKPANLLTMLFSVLLYLCLAVWPVIGGLEKGRLEIKLYVLISLSAVYVLALMAVYLLSAALKGCVQMRSENAGDFTPTPPPGALPLDPSSFFLERKKEPKKEL